MERTENDTVILEDRKMRVQTKIIVYIVTNHRNRFKTLEIASRRPSKPDMSLKSYSYKQLIKDLQKTYLQHHYFTYDSIRTKYLLNTPLRLLVQNGTRFWRTQPIPEWKSITKTTVSVTILWTYKPKIGRSHSKACHI